MRITGPDRGIVPVVGIVPVRMEAARAWLLLLLVALLPLLHLARAAFRHERKKILLHLRNASNTTASSSFDATEVRPHMQCDTPIFASRPRIHSSMAKRVPLNQLMSNATRRSALLTRAEQWMQGPSRRPRDSLEKLRVVLCLGGVIPRGIKYAWPAIEQRIVTPLRERGHTVDVYGINLIQGDIKEKFDKRRIELNQEDRLAVPFDFLEEIDADDAEEAIDTRCDVKKTCPTWHTAGHNFHRPEKQLLSENRMGEFLLLRSTLQRGYDVAICWWSDYLPIQKLDPGYLDRAVSHPRTLGARPHHSTSADAPRSAVDGFYLGTPLTVSKILMRWSDEELMKRHFQMYESTVGASLTRYHLDFAEVNLAFTKVRTYGLDDDQWSMLSHAASKANASRDLYGDGVWSRWKSAKDMEIDVERCNERKAAEARHDSSSLSRTHGSDVVVHMNAQHRRWSSPSRRVQGATPSKGPGRIVNCTIPLAVGRVQVMALLTNESAASFDDARANAPQLGDASNYLQSLPKRILLPGEGSTCNVPGESRCVLLVRWYDARPCAGDGCACAAGCAGCVKYTAALHRQLEWVSSARVISAVQLRPVPSTERGRGRPVDSGAWFHEPQYTLPLAEMRWLLAE